MSRIINEDTMKMYYSIVNRKYNNDESYIFERMIDEYITLIKKDCHGTECYVSRFDNSVMINIEFDDLACTIVYDRDTFSCNRVFKDVVDVLTDLYSGKYSVTEVMQKAIKDKGDK